MMAWAAAAIVERGAEHVRRRGRRSRPHASQEPSLRASPHGVRRAEGGGSGFMRPPPVEGEPGRDGKLADCGHMLSEPRLDDGALPLALK